MLAGVNVPEHAESRGQRVALVGIIKGIEQIAVGIQQGGLDGGGAAVKAQPGVAHSAFQIPPRYPASGMSRGKGPLLRLGSEQGRQPAVSPRRAAFFQYGQAVLKRHFPLGHAQRMAGRAEGHKKMSVIREDSLGHVLKHGREAFPQ